MEAAVSSKTPSQASQHHTVKYSHLQHYILPLNYFCGHQHPAFSSKY